MACLIIVLNWSSGNSEQSECRNSKFPPLKSCLVGWWGGLFDYSVKPGPDLSRSRLRMVRLLRGKVAEGLGQELDNISLCHLYLLLEQAQLQLTQTHYRSLFVSINSV